VKIHIEPTSRIVTVAAGAGEIPARVWQGRTENGIEITCLVTRIAAHVEADRAELEAALERQADPSPASLEAWPARVIL
jgi:hypothetical protein